MKTANIEKQKDFIAVLTGLVTVLSGIGITCYALGFTIVRIHLLQYEVGITSLPVARYISVIKKM